MPKDIYLDHAATTPLDPAVADAMLPVLTGVHGNPSSVHRLGQRAKAHIEGARGQVARSVGASAKGVVFTSGATEADNHALRAAAAARPGMRIVTSRVEHAAVLATARELAAAGTPVTFLDPEPDGTISIERVADALGDDVGLVALMYVNNETGVVTDIPAVSALAHEAGAWMFTDAVQAFGCMPVDLTALGADLMSLSAHKAYGPKGVGALIAREGFELPPMLAGGSQERGLRPGTENVAGIVGFGAAAELAADRHRADGARIEALRDQLEALLLCLPDVRANAGGARRGPKHLNVRVGGVDGETLLMALDAAGVAASAGSACAAGSIEPSHVLLAMGLGRSEAKASIRFSLGRDLDEAAVDDAAGRIELAVASARRVAI